MMDDLSRLDLTPLDPARDPDRWAARMASTRQAVAAVLAARSRRIGPIDVLSGWARPILAAAAVLLVLLGAADRMVGTPAAPEPTPARRLALLSESAIAHGRPPSGAELRAMLDRPRPR